jgi:hypothetical protein
MSNTYQLVTAMHNGAGNFAQNVFHASLSEAGVGEAWDYANALITAWLLDNATNYLAFFGDDVVLDYMSAKRVSGLKGPSAVQSVTSAGGNTNFSISAGIGADIAWQSGSPLNRPGHTYLPYLYKAAIEEDSWAASFETTAANFINSILAGGTLAGALGTYEMGLFSRSTFQFNKFTHGQLMPKPTMLNKRTLPQI